MSLALPESSPFLVLDTGAKEMRLAIQENLPDGISPFDLDRVRVPSGGGQTWTVPSLDGDSEIKEIAGIIVSFKDVKTYWKESFDETGGGTPPDCYSADTIIGVGDPGGACKRCVFNQFGSAEKGAGKACRDQRMLFVLREGDMLPIVLSVPPSSLQDVRKYFTRLAGQGISFYACISRFSLTKDKSGSGITYSKIVPALTRRLGAEEVERVRAYSAVIREAASQANPDGVDSPSAYQEDVS